MRKTICALALLLVATFGSQQKLSARTVGKIFGTPSIAVAGEWKVRVEFGETLFTRVGAERQKPVTLEISPAQTVDAAETYELLPLWNPNTAGWLKGAQLRGLIAQEVTAPDYLDPQSVVVMSAPDGETFTRGIDYELDSQWGTIGRLPNGKIGADTKVFILYRHGLGRLDSVIRHLDGSVSIRRGEAKINLPQPPQIGAGETRIANIWVFGRITQLSDDNIFPILNGAARFNSGLKIAERLLPKTLAKLRSGAPLKILAWGDSVTDGSYLPSLSGRWQEQFVARLQQRFPKAKIELVTEAWGGRNTQSYLDEPPGSPHNYRERVLAARPDLIVSEFVNDANLSPQQVEERYGNFLKDFREIGAEWIIQTPHYVAPSWMGLNREKNVDDDPRPYVAGLRAFAAKHNVALADASAHWGQLYKQGIPYTTLLGNMVNHPDARGMKLFADALLELFPQK